MGQRYRLKIRSSSWPLKINNKFLWIIKILSIVILIFPIFFQVNYLQAESVISGIVRWQTGTGAFGIEIQLVDNNRIISKTYTNHAGRYQFVLQSMPPASCRVRLIYDGKSFVDLKLSQVYDNGKMEDIIIK